MVTLMHYTNYEVNPFPLHEKYNLDEVVSGTTGDKRRYYIVKAIDCQDLKKNSTWISLHILCTSTKKMILDLDGYSSKDQPLKPTTRSFTRKIERFYQLSRRCGDAVYWIVPVKVPTLQLRLFTMWLQTLPDAATSRPFPGPLAFLERS